MTGKECCFCEHCWFTSVPELYHGRGGWCRVKQKNVDYWSRKLFCKKFREKDKDGENDVR